MTDRVCQPKWKHDKYGCGTDVIADLKGEKWLAGLHNEYLKEFGQKWSMNARLLSLMVSDSIISNIMCQSA